MSQPDRREFVASLLAASAAPAALAGCNSRQPGYPNLYALLKPFTFLDREGNPISEKGLREKLKDRYVTLSFGYGGCKDYCAPFESSIAFMNDQAEQAGVKLASIIINVKPEEQGATAESRLKNLDEIRQAASGKIDAHPLYVVDPATGRPSAKELVKLIQAAGSVPNIRQPEKHTDTVHLFAPGGDHLATGSSTRFLTNEWENHFVSPARGAVRG